MMTTSIETLTFITFVRLFPLFKKKMKINKLTSCFKVSNNNINRREDKKFRTKD